MSHIFVSYSRKDSETVDHIVSRLNGDGLYVWIDREEIKGGELWRRAIVEAIDNAYACVLMLSSNSVASDNVRKEVDLAEGSDKELIPVLLAPVKLPAELRYQLAGIQWIEYYRDPETKYDELVQVLKSYQQKLGIVQTPPTREVELVFRGLDLSKLSDEEKNQLGENMLDLISTSTHTPRADLNLVKMTDGSIYAFVNMPADSAYKLKTAALNRDSRLINFGIDALRLSGDRKFVLLKTGRIGTLKPRKSVGPRWFIGGLALVTTVLLSALIISVMLPRAATIISSFFATATPTPTYTFTPTPSYTPTSTKTFTPTLTPTSTPTSTWTPTSTQTPTLTPSPTRTPTATFTYTPTPPNITPPLIPYMKTSTSRVDAPAGSCGDPTTLTVSVLVTDQSGVQKVTLLYSYNGINQEPIEMFPVGSGLGVTSYRATIDVGNTYSYNKNGVIGLTVEALDNAGNSASKSSWPVFVYYCTPPPK